MATAIVWVRRAREGEWSARKQGQPKRSRLDPHWDYLPGLIAAEPDITSAEMQARLVCGAGVSASVGMIRTFLDRAGLTFKKRTAHASEQDRPNVPRRREEWFEGQLDLDPERLVFIDETWTSKNMARLHGRALAAERLRAPPHHGWLRHLTSGKVPAGGDHDEPG